VCTITLLSQLDLSDEHYRPPDRQVLGYNISVLSIATEMRTMQTRSNPAFMPLIGFLFIPLAVSFMPPMIVYQLVLDKTHGQLEMVRLVC